MHWPASAFIVVFAIGAGLPSPAQITFAPVLSPRGAQNEFTLQPAPSVVNAGGLLRLTGLNFVMTGEWKADLLPLPLEYGDPPLQVLVGNRPAGLLEVTPTRILCQVPVESPAGLMTVVVRRGEQMSRVARFMVQRVAPALRTLEGKGSGEAKGAAGGKLNVRAMGLGRTEPVLATGEAGDAEPVEPVRVLIDGLPVDAVVRHSAEAPGEFEIRAESVGRAQAGDMLQVVAGGSLGHLTTYGRRTQPETVFVPWPEGLADPRAITPADLRHAYAVVNGARDAEGCYPSWLFDFSAASATRLEDCMTAANRAAAAAWIAPANTGVLASWVGPAEADPALGVSARLRILNPARETPLEVTLPFNGQTLQTTPDGGLLAVGPGGDAMRVDPLTGEVTEPPPPVNPPAAGGGGAAGGALAQALQSREIDLGDGVKRRILSQPPRQVTQAGVPLIVADSADGSGQPQLVLVNNRLEVLGTKPFPDGWLPLVPPAQPVQVRPGQPAPAPQPTNVPLELDLQARTVYVLAKQADNARHGFVLFALDDTPARPVGFPDGWYAAACTSNIALFNLELTRRAAVFGSRTPETAFRAQCPARGLIEISLGAQPAARVSELPGQGAVNVSAGISDVNDYLYATDADPTQQGAAGTMFVFDSASESAVRLDLPAGINAFVQPRALPEMNAILALARNSTAGDAGLVYFDLESTEARLLPTPDGFASMQFLGVFPATRKLLARGIREGGAGTQYVLYDLITFDSTVLANPRGVAYAGFAPASPPATAITMERLSQKSNSVVAVGFSAARRPAGALLIRIP